MHGDEPVVDFAERAEVLARDVVGGLALLTIPRLIDEERHRAVPDGRSDEARAEAT